MERKALSSKLIVEKIVILLSLVVFLFIIAGTAPTVLQDLLWIVPIYVGVFYIVFFLPDGIEFDAENIYLKRRHHNYTIPLKDISVIKITGISIGYRSLWKLECKVNGIEGDARFYNRSYFSPAFNNFCNHVKLKNPKVEVRKFGWSFDV
jgi:hypothetical protein